MLVAGARGSVHFISLLLVLVAVFIVMSVLHISGGL
jgi:hypothetical protein